MDQADLLALELVQAAFLLADVFDECRGLAPVSRGQVEHPGKHAAVGGRRQAVTHRQDWNLVLIGLGNNRVGDAGRIRVVDNRALGFGALVALDADIRFIAGLALLDDQLDAVDPAVARIEQLEIVVQTIGDWRAAIGVTAGAVGQERDVNPIRRLRRGKRRRGKNRRRRPRVRRCT